jgi:hypothetical protein
MPPGETTITSTVPGAAPAGTAAVSWVLEVKWTDVAAAPPKLTVAPLVKPVPVIVTELPPETGPASGVTPVTAGAGSYVYWSAGLIAEVPPIVETVMSTVPAD